MKYKISVERNTLRFSAAHFTASHGQAERLHGHNYDLLVEVEGQLSEDAWVIDFGELKRIAEALCQQLDHRFLLPRDNPALTVTDLDDAWQIASPDGRYVIPRAMYVHCPWTTPPPSAWPNGSATAWRRHWRGEATSQPSAWAWRRRPARPAGAPLA